MAMMRNRQTSMTGASAFECEHDRLRIRRVAVATPAVLWLTCVAVRDCFQKTTLLSHRQFFRGGWVNEPAVAAGIGENPSCPCWVWLVADISHLRGGITVSTSGKRRCFRVEKYSLLICNTSAPRGAWLAAAHFVAIRLRERRA